MPASLTDKLKTSELGQEACRVVQTLVQSGHQALLAGGCVRDLIMGRTPKDYDVATNATPAEVQRLFPDTREVGKAFGVVNVILGGHSVEVATFRRDLQYKDGRHPTTVEFTTAEEDARRRDFTINGLFLDPVADKVIDYVGGQEDIQKHLVRAIGEPDKRFSEDYLRMLRAVRFTSTLEFTLDEHTAAAIRRLASQLAHVSAERIQQEFGRILTESPRAGQGVQLLYETGLLEIILPELVRAVGVEQPPEFHPEGDVFRHTLLMLDAMASPSRTLAYAVLLHDIGKPPTARRVKEDNGKERIRFDGHDKVGAEMTETIMKRLRMPNDEIEAVTYCVRNHMRFRDVTDMRKSTLRQLVGAPTFPVELELHRLDCLCSHGSLSNYEFLQRFVEELRNEPALPAPWITGHDIMALGVPEGKNVGQWHRKAYEAQIEGRFSSREELLKWLRDSLAKVDPAS